MSKAKSFRDLSEEDLNQGIEERQREILDLRHNKLDKKSQKTHLICQKRKEIARILTILGERKRANI